MKQQKPKDNDFVSVSGTKFYHSQIFEVVDTFYQAVAIHPSLKEPFKSVEDWPEHIEKMTHFWWLRLGGKPYLFYQYNPVLKHFEAGFNQEFLSQWLGLFHQTLREKLNTEQVKIWENLSSQMGRGLFARNEMLRAQANESI